MRKILIMLAFCFVFFCTGCGEETSRTFEAEYEVLGTLSDGQAKNDTYVFKGVTNEKDEIIELEFDIIHNKGLESEYSKKGLMNYFMNISDVKITENENGYSLDKITAYGYHEDYSENGQYMISAKHSDVKVDTLFGELEFQNDATGGEESVEIDKAIIAFEGLANEVGIVDLSERTPVAELLVSHKAYAEGEFFETEARVSFEGVAGGRSYGEQLEAIRTHILENKMTLEEVYEMFKTENQVSTKVVDRDAVAGASIAFTENFQQMVYLAMTGEVFEGVTNGVTKENGSEVYEVVAQGYGGEIEMKVTIDGMGKISDIEIVKENESAGFGRELLEEDSEFLATIIRDDGEVDEVAGVTITSSAVKKALEEVKKYNE